MRKGNETDSFIIERLKQGDLEAFNALYRQHHGRLYGFCLKLTGQEEDARDIVQDAFTKIWEIRELLDEHRSFDSLLFTISKNMVYNRARKRVYERAYQDYLMRETKAHVYDLNAFLEYSEQGIILQRAIESLPEKGREIFKMSRLDGLTNKEIAEKLGTSVSNIENHIHKALKYLRGVLQSAF